MERLPVPCQFELQLKVCARYWRISSRCNALQVFGSRETGNPNLLKVQVNGFCIATALGSFHEVVVVSRRTIVLSLGVFNSVRWDSAVVIDFGQNSCAAVRYF